MSWSLSGNEYTVDSSSGESAVNWEDSIWESDSIAAEYVESGYSREAATRSKSATKNKLLSRIFKSSERTSNSNGLRRAFSYPHKFMIDSKRLEESKRRQGRLLLVSLLENFCALYDQSPQHNRKLFFMICKTLSGMGLIDEEYIDEMAGVRSAYMSTFKQLVIQAMATMKQEVEPKPLQRMMSIGYRNDKGSPDNSDYFSGNHETHNSFETPSVKRTYSKLSKMSFTDILELYNSRYETDFIEVRKLGRGGFGSVFKVQNKLDGSEYAVKKIRLRSEKTRHEKIFREIKFLSKLDHPNVVRYYGSWLENVKRSFDDESEEDLDYEYDHDEFSQDLVASPLQSQTFDSDLQAVPDDASESLTNSEDSNSIEFAFDDPDSVADSKDVASSPSQSTLIHLGKETQIMPFDDFSACESQDAPVKPPAGIANMELTLFIQMQLCHSTLYDYLDARNRAISNPQNGIPIAIDSSANLQLFRAIVQGVAYIHDQDMIHRDLKPMNIFLDCSIASDDDPEFLIQNVDVLVPRIGDFGLVTGMEDFITPSSRPDSRKQSICSGSSSSRTSRVGTITYASPEQLADPPQMYDQKSDIYSLGIILFELYCPFSTLMERAQLLQNLRHGVLPDGFLAKWPKEATLVLWLMAEDPTKRPTAREILEFDMLIPPTYGSSRDNDTQYAELERRTTQLQQENEELRARLAELETRLSRCSCQHTDSQD
ncbi:kinase-like protein [Basidiobolus meristosporus CBS 931.73]|uniref:Eukaryotic translation initiation factor 2-alpha kinase 1 n=1 Tax=Basidiobolus meristosporus CBS 931.73 TaxID=1314790 RepID=A0A1Y1YKW3_9FUNG|nr:kinase-like protein [Basidiobolus meristosporus CBS 931.73]|eukprot:ORX98622.1 kinase-like protein [Basidiobolus meristosporus CBS 931.73]